MNQPFKLAFPVITLPEQMGGKRAIILYSMQRKDDATGVCYAQCIAIDGRVHQNVPIAMSTIQAALLKPVHFLEVDPTDSPLILLP